MDDLESALDDILTTAVEIQEKVMDLEGEAEQLRMKVERLLQRWISQS